MSKRTAPQPATLLDAQSEEAKHRKLPAPSGTVVPEQLPEDAPDSIHPHLREKLRLLPERPGVYLMRDERERVIYVGKSVCLKNRVNSYFHSHNLVPRIKWMVSLIRNFEIFVVNSEMEALLLENTMIKKYRPYFNVLFRDDKHYPAIELTTGEAYPRLRVVRQFQDSHNTCFGPYPDGGAVKRTKKMLQKLFRIRTCRNDLAKPLPRPCLDYHINLCTAPCTRLVSQEEYREQIRMACDFLNGHTARLISSLKEAMEKASEAWKFEEAANLRDLIRDLKVINEHQKVIFDKSVDEDFIAAATRKDLCCMLVWQIREGKLLGQHSFFMNSRLGEADSNLEAFIQQYYSENQLPPPTINLNIPLQNLELLQNWLSDLRKSSNLSKCELRLPQRGNRSQVMQMTQDNAERCLGEELSVPSRLELRQQALEELKNALKLPHLPRRMECFDISNISGKFAVGSMVVFEHGLPHRSHYRRFKIKGMDTPNDFAMMNQVLRRRFDHALNTESGAHKPDPSLDDFPDLLIVDGGKGQLGIAVEILEELQLTDKVRLAGLAKREEELFLPHLAQPVCLTENSPAYNMVTHLRDEAHRFAITYHRRLRGKSTQFSSLDVIPGIGSDKKRALLKHFASFEDIVQAEPSQLEAVPGIGPGTAAKIYRALHPDS